MFKVDIEPQKFNIKFFGFVFIKYSYKRGYSGKCHFFVFFGCITFTLTGRGARSVPEIRLNVLLGSLTKLHK